MQKKSGKIVFDAKILASILPDFFAIFNTFLDFLC